MNLENRQRHKTVNIIQKEVWNLNFYSLTLYSLLNISGRESREVDLFHPNVPADFIYSVTLKSIICLI